MSVKVMSHIWQNSQQAHGPLLVLLALADFADDDGKCYPAVETIAEKARMAPRQVQRVLKDLEADGELAVKKNAGPHGCNLYIVSLENKGVKKSGVTKRRGDKKDRGGDISGKKDAQNVTRTVIEPSKNNTPTETPTGVSVEEMLSPAGKPTGEWWRYGVKVLSVGEVSDKGLRGLLGRESGRHGPKKVLEALRQTENAKPAEPKSYFLGILKKVKTADDVCTDFIARMRAKAEGVTYGTGDPKRQVGHAEGTDNAIVPSPTASAA